MLEEEGTEGVYIAKTKALGPRLRGEFYQASTFGPGEKHYGATRLIALLELLRTVEDV